MQTSYAKETWVGLFVLLGLICVAYLTVKLGKMELTGGSGYTVNAVFSDVSGLRSGAAVEISGVSVGKVSSIQLDPQYGTATVVLYLDQQVRLRDDTIAAIKTSGLIGDKYVKLILGGSPDYIEPGGRISDTQSALDIEDLIGKYAFGSVE